MNKREQLATIVDTVKGALNDHGLTLDDFVAHIGDKNTIEFIDTGDRERLEVRVEQVGKESVLVTLDGKVVGRQVKYKNYEYYFGHAPHRTRGFRVTLIPDK